MKDVTINIPDMQSAHCQARVNKAVKDIDGVAVQNLQAGQITVSMPAEGDKEKVITAIEKAGYNVL